MDRLARISDQKTQTIKNHIEGVERRSREWALHEYSSSASLAAFLHDMGKYQDEWQTYLHEAASQKNPKIIPHAPLGAMAIDYLVGKKTISIKSERVNVARDILTYVIRSHHGMFDALTLDGNHSLDKNLKEGNLSFDVLHNQGFKDYCLDFDWTFIENRWEQTVIELSGLIDKVMTYKENPAISPSFALGAVIRYLLSLLIDADWSDAASMNSLDEMKWKEIKKKVDFGFLHSNLVDYIDSLKVESPIGNLRQTISEESENAASRTSGIYRMNVPTGGGKTFAVMRFALSHAVKYKKERIIYVAPFKSIVDQTATEYRKSLLGDLKDKAEQYAILEHHGDVLRLDIGDEQQIWDLLLSNWDAPIIITTLVQLLNTMISSNKASIRRLHQLSNSIIILDEFQAVPIKSMSLLNSWLNILSEFFNTTVILCTATQPPLEEVIYDKKSFKGLAPIQYALNPELVDDYSSDLAFDRTRIINKCTSKGYSIVEAEELIQREISEVQSMLIILNTRSSAEKLFLKLKVSLPQTDLQLLSNNMVPAHRKTIIRGLRDRLKSANESGPHPNRANKLVVISTSLIEAGVDLSFQRVIRSLAGLDSIIQAAGRCNRNGELGQGMVLVFNPMAEWENIGKMTEIVIAQDCIRPILNNFEKNPSKYGGNLMSKVAIEHYFRSYYGAIAGKTHFPIRTGGINTSIYELLDNNKQAVLKYQKKPEVFQHLINQSFRTAGDLYEPIESGDIKIIVDWEGGKSIVLDLGSTSDRSAIKAILHEAQQYSLGVFRYQFDILKEKGAIISVMEDKVWVLREEFYSKEQGLMMTGKISETIMV